MKKIIILTIFLILIPLVMSLEANSSSFSINSYLGVASDNYSGYGQSLIGKSIGTNYALYAGIFYMNNVTVTNITAPSITCGVGTLFLCTNQTACESIGGFWWLYSCHSYEMPNGGGGSSGGGMSEIKYNVYPKVMQENFKTNISLNKGSFYIQNLEISSPLDISIYSDLYIYNKQLRVNPGETILVNFYVNTTDKIGYYTEKILLKIVKNPTLYKYENITINYYSTTDVIIPIINSTNNTNNTKKIINFISFINNQTKQDITEAAKKVNSFVQNPVFLIIIFSFLIILIIIFLQLSGFGGENIFKNPISYVLLIAVIFFIWFMKTKKSFDALSYIIMGCILAILIIIFLQNKKQESDLDLFE